MKKLCGILAILFAICLMGHVAVAKDCKKTCDKKQEEQKMEAYAHPTMFGSADLEVIAPDAAYVIGGNVKQPEGSIGVKGKDHVLVGSWCKDILTTLKESSKNKDFDEKMPVLRSELAVILAEGLSLNDTKSASKYSDVTSDYWAKKWIDKALAAKVMIGYPDNTFKPDQRVTKAEVFAVLATLIDVKYDKKAAIPAYKGMTMQYIPKWAYNPTKEVMASGLLENVPEPKKVAESEYLSKEQVAYIVGTLRQYYTTGKMGSGAFGKYNPVCVNIKINERLSARTSNIGDTFYSRTTKAVAINGVNFPENSVVKGEVVEVSRPGLDNPGYLRVKFLHIKNGDKCRMEFPNELSEAQACKLRNPNFLARLLGAPLSTVGRVAGVAGRSLTTGGVVVSNGVEQLGDNLSNTLVNTFDLHPGSGLKSFGSGFVTVGKTVYGVVKLIASGTFGVFYEVGDEIRYLIVPAYTNESSLNPGEEMCIVF